MSLFLPRWMISLPRLSTMFISKGLPGPQHIRVQQSLSSFAKNTSWPRLLNTRYLQISINIYNIYTSRYHLLADSQPVNISSISYCCLISRWSTVARYSRPCGKYSLSFYKNISTDMQNIIAPPAAPRSPAAAARLAGCWWPRARGRGTASYLDSRVISIHIYTLVIYNIYTSPSLRRVFTAQIPVTI